MLRSIVILVHGTNRYSKFMSCRYLCPKFSYNSCVEIEGRSRCPLRVGADRTTYNDTQWADCKCGFYNCIIETPNIYSKLSPGTPCEFPFTSYGSNLEFQGILGFPATCFDTLISVIMFVWHLSCVNYHVLGCAKSSDGTSWCPAGIDDDGSFAWGNYGTCSCTLSATPWPSSSSGSNDGSESVESSIGSGDKTGSGSAVMGIVIATCIAICVMKIYRKRVINPVNMTELNSQGTVGEKSITVRFNPSYHLLKNFMTTTIFLIPASETKFRPKIFERTCQVIQRATCFLMAHRRHTQKDILGKIYYCTTN